MSSSVDSATTQWLTAILAIVSLALFFGVGFPWQQHNESLVWAIELQKISWWDILISNPITPVQTYRPFGVGLAWATFHATNGGIWLQQLINFALTAGAWILALRSVSNRYAFAWLSLLCGAGYFAGYIYLFHLHGVFYGPLLIFLALLLILDKPELILDSRRVWVLFGITAAFALFHTFSLLLFVAYVAGRWLQNRLAGHTANLSAVITSIVLAAVAMKLLVAKSGDLGAGGAVQGLLASYRALEINRMVAVLSGTLSVLAALSVDGTVAKRIGYVLAALALVWLLSVKQVPIIFAWIVVCGIKAAWSRDFGLAALIGVCALLPVATGTGSPTYALFVLMPCVVAMVRNLPQWPELQLIQHGVALIVIVVTLMLLFLLRAERQVPIVSGMVLPLRAEQEKTEQLMQAFTWLDTHPEISGTLSLCEPGDFPVRSSNAIDRTHRAPTHVWPFAEYIKARYGQRFEQTSPTLQLCFGGQVIAGSDILYAIPGKWAGAAMLERLSTAALSTSSD